jgi:Kef-type K+ transport system membrane component KefB
MLEFPLTDPVEVFMICMMIFLVMPIFMKFLRMPGMIGPIIAGVIVGPSGLGILQRGPNIQLLGTIGLLLIIFISGLEMDIDGFKKNRNRSIIFGFLSFIFPLIIGTGIGLLLGYSIAASILLGSILSSHTLLGYPIASRLGIAKNKAVTSAVGGVILTDTLALLVLAVITGSTTGDINLSFFITLIIALTIFSLFTFLGIPIITRWFFRNISTEGATVFTFVIVVLFVSAFFAHLAGVEHIIGAFIAGVALNRLVFEHGPLMNRIHFTANALFIPFFLLSVGMLMDLRVLLSDPKTWLLTGLIVIGVIIGKYSASWVAMKMNNYSKEELNITFGLTIPQAAATLAATLVGYDVGLLDQSTVNGVIIMILITCILGPYFVEKYGRKLSLSEEHQSIDNSYTPNRIMIPLANPDTMESILNLGIILRDNKSDVPLYPLTVVQKDIRTAEEDVANAERMLGYAVMYASGADVPVRVITRVDHNKVQGMIRAIAEERITTVIVAWNSNQIKPKRIFGNVIDHLIDQTYQTVLVTKIGNPLNTTRRIVMVLPKGVNHSYGYKGAITRVKEMANNIGASLSCIVVGDKGAKYESDLKSIKVGSTTVVKDVPDWYTLYQNSLNSLKKDDLIVVISARKGTVAWHPQLEEVPKELTRLNPESFIIYYPTEDKEIDERGTSGTPLPKEVLFRRDFTK